jgi:medium-chain acyl-[acyl-carrier-protein] hydrolase
MPATHENPWIKRPKPNPGARSRLFCFPYSGAGASVYYPWAGLLPEEVETCAVQLPGRENRLSEKPVASMKELVETAASGLLPYLDKPFVFFGHSMGALLCFELARFLYNHFHLCPNHLFVSGHKAPHLARTAEPIHMLPEPEFLAEVCKLNGMAREVVKSDELMQLILPILRADFTICETYAYEESGPIQCPITALGGLQDGLADVRSLAAWVEHTKGPFSVRIFPGDHFYIHTERAALLKAISRKIRGQPDDHPGTGWQQGSATLTHPITKGE